jgi:hypothetical protein
MKTRFYDLAIFVPLYATIGVLLFLQSMAIYQQDFRSVSTEIRIFSCVLSLGIGVLLPLKSLWRNLNKCQERIRRLEERLEIRQEARI